MSTCLLLSLNTAAAVPPVSGPCSWLVPLTSNMGAWGSSSVARSCSSGVSAGKGGVGSTLR
jgi:hypothetical protein